MSDGFSLDSKMGHEGWHGGFAAMPSKCQNLFIGNGDHHACLPVCIHHLLKQDDICPDGGRLWDKALQVRASTMEKGVLLPPRPVALEE